MKNFYLFIIFISLLSMEGFSQTVTIAQDNLNSNNNSGGSGWLGNWTTSGEVQFTGGRIFMDGGTPFGRASRSVDLTNYSSATLTILGRCEDSSSGFESDDFVRVEVSTNGGASYTNLYNRTGSQICPNTNDQQNQNISVNLPVGNSNTTIRLRSDLNSGSEDYFWDNVTIQGVTSADQCDPTASGNLDTDLDGVSDVCDLDDDNDGILDTEEGCDNPDLATINFPNPEKAYLFQVVTVFTVDVNTGASSVYGTISGAGGNVNAVAINESDGLFWGESNANLLTIDPVTLNATVISSNIMPGGVNSAAYDSNNKVVVFNNDDNVFVFDADPASPNYQTLINTFAIQVPGIPDIAYNTTDGLFYGIQFSSSNLRVIDATNQTLTNLGSVANLPAGDYGAAYSLSNGSIYFANNDTGVIYEVDVNSLTATVFSNGPASATNDGAKVLNVDFDNNPICIDTDNDGIIDSLDLDSDGDGCFDVVESGGVDANNNGILDGTGINSSNGRVTGGTGGYNGAGTASITANRLVVTSNPTDQIVSTGDPSTTFTVGARVDQATSYTSGTPNYGSLGNANGTRQYLWYDGDPDNGGVALTNSAPYSGVTSATLTVSNPFVIAPKTYYVVVTTSELNTLCAREVRSAQMDPDDPCIPGPGNPDTDGDSVADICDIDDDNDGILDVDETNN